MADDLEEGVRRVSAVITAGALSPKVLAAAPFLLCALAFNADHAHATDFALNQDALKAHCAAEWRDSFTMQEFCIEQNEVGFAQFLEQVSSEAEGGMLAALDKCRLEWGIQWQMVAFCGEQQLDGRDKIQRSLSGLPDNAQAVILQTCRSDWPDDFAMTAFCAEQNAAAWKRMNN